MLYFLMVHVCILIYHLMSAYFGTCLCLAKICNHVETVERIQVLVVSFTLSLSCKIGCRFWHNNTFFFWEVITNDQYYTCHMLWNQPLVLSLVCNWRTKGPIDILFLMLMSYPVDGCQLIISAFIVMCSLR